MKQKQSLKYTEYRQQFLHTTPITPSALVLLLLECPHTDVDASPASTAHARRCT